MIGISMDNRAQIHLIVNVIITFALLGGIIFLGNRIFNARAQVKEVAASRSLEKQRSDAANVLREEHSKIESVLAVAPLADQVNQYVDEVQGFGKQRQVTVSVADINALDASEGAPLQAVRVHVLAQGTPSQLLLFLRDATFSRYLSTVSTWSIGMGTAGNFKLPTPASLIKSATATPAPLACTPWSLDAVFSLFVRQSQYSL